MKTHEVVINEEGMWFQRILAECRLDCWDLRLCRFCEYLIPHVKGEHRGKLVWFDRPVTAIEAATLLGEQGMRAGNVRELLLVGISNPGQQLECPIAAVGSCLPDIGVEDYRDGDMVVPMLGGVAPTRGLWLMTAGYRPEHCCYLAFPE